MGFKFASFGAATVPLSKIIPDIDFDMRPYGLTAAFARVPYRPIDWETEEIVIEPHEAGEQVFPIAEHVYITTTGYTELFRFHTPNSLSSHIWTFLLKNTGVSRATAGINISANGVLVYENLELPYDMAGRTFTIDLPGNAEVVVSGKSIGNDGTYIHNTSWYRYEGTVGRVIDLTGKWLALGIDMKELEANVKVQGVEIPYADYTYYFPLAPTALIMPDGWYDSEERPIIEVYK